MGGEEDVMHTTITRNGMQYVECRYSVFTVPALSSASALAYLQHLAETIPVHVLAPGDGRGRGRMDV
jgi:exonuclease V gamma subunit